MIEGAVNVASPHPVLNEAFMRVLREASGVRIGLPAAVWMLEIGALFMRTETELVLKSRRVVPGRLLHGGFIFRFPTWDSAARDLCQRWTAAHRRQSPVFSRTRHRGTGYSAQGPGPRAR